LDNKIEIVMKQDVTLTALFFPAHTLSIEVKGPGSVKIPSVAGLGGADETRFKGDITQNAPGSYLYYSDEYITLVAMPGTGATFRGWTWSGDMSQIDPKYLPLTQPLSGQMMIPLDPMSTTVTVSMQRDIKLTATFGGN
jgi:hypothetical protein